MKGGSRIPPTVIGYPREQSNPGTGILIAAIVALPFISHAFAVSPPPEGGYP